MRLLHLLTAAVVGTGMTLVAVPAASAADLVTAPNGDKVVPQKVTNRVDDNGWARDNFNRVATIHHVKGNNYTVTIADSGTFTTVMGEPTPANDDGAATLARSLTGNFTGGGSYTVKGNLKNDDKLRKLPSSFDDAAGKKVETGDWAKQFFGAKATSSGITGWKWTYKTADEQMDQDESGITGNVTGKLSSELAAAGLCRTANKTLRWTVTNARGDRARDFKYGVSLGGGKWGAVKTATVPAAGKVTVWTPPGYTLAVHYWNGYAVYMRTYAKASTKSC
ncbi:MAG: hypothetical protein JWO67_4040 [Streptosporangiaceae bacterium]|nr:hypothetical protein [Streptosporangiaceae bacterium]